MKKNLLIIGGSKVSTEIVNKAKNMNINTFVTDFYPIKKSPAKQVADVALVTDSTDIKAQLSDIKKYNIDGVITGFTDSSLPYYVQISNAAGLYSYANLEQVYWLNNKENYKKLAKEYGVPITEGFVIDINNEDTYKDIEFPLLIKPVDSSGARGVYIVKNKENLKTVSEKALEYSESKKLIVERYYDCEEVTVFFYIQNGEIYLTSVADRIVQKVNDTTIKLPTGYVFPSKHTELYMQNVYPKIKKMFESLNLKNGMIFTQCLVDGDQIRLYDLGFRLTGSLEYIIFEKMFGFNTLEMMINYSLYGEDKVYNLQQKLDNPIIPFGANITILVKPGYINQIKGIDLVKKHPSIIDVYLNYELGETVPDNVVGTLKQIAVRIFLTAKTKEDLNDLIQYCQSNIDIINETGESLIISEMKIDM